MVVAEEPVEPAQFPGTAGKRGQVRRQLRRPDRRRGRRPAIRGTPPGRGRRGKRVAAEDRAVHVPQVGARVGAEFVGEPAAQALVRGQRLGGAATTRERGHQLRPELFPQRMFGGHRGQLGDHLVVPAGGEVQLDPAVQRRQPPFGQRGHVVAVQQVRPDVGQRGASPQRQRLAQYLRLDVRVLGLPGLPE